MQFINMSRLGELVRFILRFNFLSQVRNVLERYNLA